MHYSGWVIEVAMGPRCRRWAGSWKTTAVRRQVNVFAVLSLVVLAAVSGDVSSLSSDYERKGVTVRVVLWAFSSRMPCSLLHARNLSHGFVGPLPAVSGIPIDNSVTTLCERCVCLVF